MSCLIVLPGWFRIQQSFTYTVTVFYSYEKKKSDAAQFSGIFELHVDAEYSPINLHVTEQKPSCRSLI